MSAQRHFTSWLAPYLDGYVGLRRASGAQFLSHRGLLLAFDRHLTVAAPRPPLLRQTLIEYLAAHTHLSPRARDNVVVAVWPAVAYALRHGARGDALPARPPRPVRHWRQRRPRILSSLEICALLAAAHRLPPADGLRPATIATLLGLLYVTGLRIGEALALDVGDLDGRDRLLTIRSGKFGKSRVLPLRESTVQALARYLDHPCRRVGVDPCAPVFVSCRRRRLAQCTVWSSLQDTCRAATIAKPWPRLHDLRHTFAVSRVATWYQEGRNIDSLLPRLSTYLGHVSVDNTRSYLVANGTLLQYAAARFARQTSALDEVPS
jgi:integrase